MSQTDDRIFPIFRNRAPILDRIRNRRSSESNAAESLGILVGKVVKSDDPQEIQQTEEQFKQGFTESLANELGVEVTDLNPNFVNDLTELVISAQEPDALKQQTLEDLGISTGSSGGESAESTEDRENAEGEERGDGDTETDLFTSEEESE